VALLVALLVIAGGVAGIVVAASGGGGKPASAVDATSPAAPSPSVAPTVGLPVNLVASTQQLPIGVALTWSAPAGQGSILGYLVYRNGVQIGTLPGSTTTYTDDRVSPGNSYTYEVLTRGEGSIESDRVSTVVDVPVPALSAARLSGNFNVKVKTTSQFGYTDDLGKFTLGWNFKAKCGEGACDVTWKDLNYKQFKVTLDRKSAKYSGADTGKFFGSCNGVTGTSTLTVEFHVVKAKAIDGEWRVSKFSGTLIERHSSTFGCVSGGGDFTITGTLLG
jgi:hypothetical protein